MATLKRRGRLSAADAAEQWKAAALREAYIAGRRELVERLRGMNGATYSPTPAKNDLKIAAQMAEDLALWLERGGEAQSELELKMHELHGDAGECETTNYKASAWRVREIAEAARAAAAEMPNSRKKYALPFAASAFVDLWRECEFPRPVVTVTSPAVVELGEVLTAAGGASLSEEALRNAIAVALRQL